MNRAAWDEKRKDLMERLEHAEGQVHQLQGEVETCDYELVELRTEVCQAQEAKNRVDFTRGLLRWKGTR